MPSPKERGRLECHSLVRELTSETRQGAADSIRMKERTPATKRIDEHTFGVVRKGFDPHEVKAYLEDLEHAFLDIEGHSLRTSQKVTELQRDLAVARATEKASLDNAMLAVFDVKDRIVDRAERKAREIEDLAGKQASSVLVDAAAARGHEPELEARISAMEQKAVRSRADGERLRMQLNEAHAALDHLESTTTVDITSLQAQIKHEQQQNTDLRAAAHEVDFVRREFEHKLAQAQQQAMHARAEAEVARAELAARRGAATESSDDDNEGRVVYEHPGEIADYEFAVGTMDDDRYHQQLSEAM